MGRALIEGGGWGGAGRPENADTMRESFSPGLIVPDRCLSFCRRMRRPAEIYIDPRSQKGSTRTPLITLNRRTAPPRNQIPLLGINSDPITEADVTSVNKKKTDERRSHGALCMCTSNTMKSDIPDVLHGGGSLLSRARIQCIVKSTFSETRLVPALNDLLIANPSPAAVSRFRMGWLKRVDMPPPSSTPRDPASSLNEPRPPIQKQYGTVSRFGGVPYDIRSSLNVWSSGMWVSTGTGSSAAMAAAGGQPMPIDSTDLQYLIREHMIERANDRGVDVKGIDHGLLKNSEQLHLRWNSQKGRIFIDGGHLSHNLELGDEVLINNEAPPLHLFTKHT